MYITVPKGILNTHKKFLLFIKANYLTPSLCPTFYKQLGSHIYLGQWQFVLHSFRLNQTDTFTFAPIKIGLFCVITLT